MAVSLVFDEKALWSSLLAQQSLGLAPAAHGAMSWKQLRRTRAVAHQAHPAGGHHRAPLRPRRMSTLPSALPPTPRPCRHRHHPDGVGATMCSALQTQRAALASAASSRFAQSQVHAGCLLPAATSGQLARQALSLAPPARLAQHLHPAALTIPGFLRGCIRETIVTQKRAAPSSRVRRHRQRGTTHVRSGPILLGPMRRW